MSNTTNTNRRIRDCHLMYVCQETYHCATIHQCIACAYKIATFDVVQDVPFTSQTSNARPESCPRFWMAETSSNKNHKPKRKTDTFVEDDGEEEEERKSSDISSSHVPSSWLGFTPYNMNILTIGDGDFSFSLALKTKLISIIPHHHDDDSTASFSLSHLVATSFESMNVLSQIYPNIHDTLHALNLSPSSSSEGQQGSSLPYLQTTICTQVDATQLEKTLFSSTSSHANIIPHSYHRIIWNFPCLAIPQGQDGQNQQMNENKILIRQFIRNIITTTSTTTASYTKIPILEPNTGELWITHKTKPPFDQWDLIQQVELAQQEEPEDKEEMKQNISMKLVYQGCIVFDKCLFPCYIPKKALDSKSFTYHDACIYIFRPMSIPTEADRIHLFEKQSSISTMNNNNIHTSTTSISSIINTLPPRNHPSVGGSTSNSNIIPVTPCMIERIRQIHLMIATKRMYDQIDYGHQDNNRKKKNKKNPKGITYQPKKNKSSLSSSSHSNKRNKTKR